jgi:hypothetical protein
MHTHVDMHLSLCRILHLQPSCKAQNTLKWSPACSTNICTVHHHVSIWCQRLAQVLELASTASTGSHKASTSFLTGRHDHAICCVKDGMWSQYGCSQGERRRVGGRGPCTTHAWHADNAGWSPANGTTVVQQADERCVTFKEQHGDQQRQPMVLSIPFRKICHQDTQLLCAKDVDVHVCM